MTDQMVPLFDLPGVPDEPVPPLSPGRRLTRRQRADLERGVHPLAYLVGGLALHPDAAPAAPDNAPGLRCNGCRFRDPGTFPKCRFPDMDDRSTWKRVSSCAASDCRGWWPACTDYQPKP